MRRCLLFEGFGKGRRETRHGGGERPDSTRVREGHSGTDIVEGSGNGWIKEDPCQSGEGVGGFICKVIETILPL